MQADTELIRLAANTITAVGAIALAHFSMTNMSRGQKLSIWGLIVPLCGSWVILFSQIAASPNTDLILLAAMTFSFAAVLFMLVSEAMLAGLANRLTQWRGEKWVKELDYFYLALGALGIVLSMNRIEGVDHKLPIPDFVGPFILAIAIVLRAIEARAEINGWNKLSASGTITRHGSNAFAWAVAWGLPLVSVIVTILALGLPSVPLKWW